MLRSRFWSLVLATSLVATLASFRAVADQTIPDDLIIEGSVCIGLDCTVDQEFGFSTAILQENNLRVFFNDTSTAAAFPANDWEIIANDSANEGDSYLGFADRGAGLVTTSGSGTCEGGVNDGLACGVGASCPGLCDANSGPLEGTECSDDSVCNLIVGSGASCLDPGQCISPGAVIFRIEAGGPEDSLVIDPMGDVNIAGDLNVEGSINGSASDLQALQAQVDSLEGQVGGLEGQVSTLEGEVGGLESQVTMLQGEVGALQGDVTTLQGRVNSLEASVEMILNLPGIQRRGQGHNP
jgi:outer membrane murein-binding lipoprotein Lpp